MNTLDYQKQLDLLLSHLSHEELKNGIRSYAYEVQPEEREHFLSCISSEKAKPLEETEGIIEDATNLLNKCMKGEIFLQREWSEDGDWKNSDEEYVITDTMGVAKSISKAIDIADSYAQNLNYASALRIYALLLDLSLPIKDEYSGETMYGLDELFDSDCFSAIDFALVGGNALYAAYRLDIPFEQKAKTMVEMIGSKLCKYTEYDLFLTCGKERFESLKEFLPYLVKKLSLTPGEQQRKWLADCSTITLLKQCLPDGQIVHPSMWMMLMEKLLEEDETEAALECGNTALNQLPKSLMERSRVANLCASIFMLLEGNGPVDVHNVREYFYISEQGKRSEKFTQYLYARFASHSDFITFLSLYRVMNKSSYWTRQLFSEISQIPDGEIAKDNFKELERNTLSPTLKVLILFLLNPTSNAFNAVVQKGKAIDPVEGNIVLNFFVAIFYLQKHKAGLATHLIPYRNSMHHSNKLYYEFYFSLDDQMQKKVLLWCVQTMHSVVKGILDGENIHLYTYAATLIVSLDIVLADRSMKFSRTQNAQEFYRSIYAAIPEFISIIDSMKE